MRKTLAIALTLAATGCAGRAASESKPSTTRRASTTVASVALRGHEVAFTMVGPPVALQKPECTPGCVVPYSTSGTVTGSLIGDVTGAGAVRLDGSNFTAATTLLFRGRVEGCGAGTLALRRREDGDLNARARTGTWDITAGFGTGALESASGAGTMNPVESDPGAGKIASAFRGRFECDAPIAPTRSTPSVHGGFAATFAGTIAPPPVSSPVCDKKGGCVFPTTQHTRYTGTIEGTGAAQGDGVVKPVPGGFAYVATSLEVVTANIAPCGRGTVVIVIWSRFSVTDLTFSWELVPGFGSGALDAARGAGTASGTRKADGTYVTSWSGRLSCR